jgi:hypothetical protein
MPAHAFSVQGSLNKAEPVSSTSAKGGNFFNLIAKYTIMGMLRVAQIWLRMK